jgi:hypothetical protein
LLDPKLIEELSEQPDPAHDDERRRYYRLTLLGRRVAPQRGFLSFSDCSNVVGGSR